MREQNQPKFPKISLQRLRNQLKQTVFLSVVLIFRKILAYCPVYQA